MGDRFDPIIPPKLLSFSHQKREDSREVHRTELKLIIGHKKMDIGFKAICAYPDGDFTNLPITKGLIQSSAIESVNILWTE